MKNVMRNAQRVGRDIANLLSAFEILGNSIDGLVRGSFRHKTPAAFEELKKFSPQQLVFTACFLAIGIKRCEQEIKASLCKTIHRAQLNAAGQSRLTGLPIGRLTLRQTSCSRER